MCRYREMYWHIREMYYFFSLTAARTLIILTILALLRFFLIISRHESCAIVHLHAPLQLNYLITPTWSVLLILRPLI